MKLAFVKYGQVSRAEMKSAQHPDYYLIKQLSSKYRIDVYTYGTKKEKFSLTNISVINYPIVRKGTFSRIRTAMSLIFFPTMIFAKLVSTKPKAVVCMGGNLELCPAFVYCKLFNKSLISIFAQEFNKKAYADNTIVYRIVKLLLQNKTIVSVLAISKEVFKQLVSAGISNKTSLVDYIRPANCIFKACQKKHKKFNILFVGRLVPNKGISTLIDVANRLCGLKTKIDFTITVVGDGPGKELFKKQIGNSRLTKYFELKGSHPYENMPSFFQNADCFFLPTKSEALGLVVIEALLCEKPVVASRVGGVKDLVKHGKTGYLARPTDSKSFSDAICKLATDKRNYNVMIDNIRKDKKRFFESKRSIIDATNNSLERALSDKP